MRQGMTNKFQNMPQVGKMSRDGGLPVLPPQDRVTHNIPRTMIVVVAGVPRPRKGYHSGSFIQAN